jgi:hypothetical protein
MGGDPCAVLDIATGGGTLEWPTGDRGGRMDRRPYGDGVGSIVGENCHG